MNVLDIIRRASASKNTKPALIAGAGVLGATVPFARNLMLNELLGVDDFKRAIKYADEGEFSKMLKSLGSGAFELGSTAIPGGAILKGAKAGKAVAKASPIGGRVISRLPGMVQGGNLTPAGMQALQAFRMAEGAQIADAVNAGSQMFMGRGVNLGSARDITKEAEMARNMEVIRRMLAGGA